MTVIDFKKAQTKNKSKTQYNPMIQFSNDIDYECGKHLAYGLGVPEMCMVLANRLGKMMFDNRASDPEGKLINAVLSVLSKEVEK